MVDAASFIAEVAELVDAHVSGACVFGREGSNPSFGTSLVFMDNLSEKGNSKPVITSILSSIGK